MKNVNIICKGKKGKVEVSFNKDHFLIETDVPIHVRPEHPVFSSPDEKYKYVWKVYFQDHYNWNSIAYAVISRVQWLLGYKTDISNLKEFLDWAAQEE